MMADRSSPTRLQPPSVIGCLLGFAGLSAPAGAFAGLLSGLAAGAPPAACEPLAASAALVASVAGAGAGGWYARRARPESNRAA